MVHRKGVEEKADERYNEVDKHDEVVHHTLLLAALCRWKHMVKCNLMQSLRSDIYNCLASGLPSLEIECT